MKNMIYLQSKKFILLIVAVVLFFVFEGGGFFEVLFLKTYSFVFGKWRVENSFENTALYEKIKDLESKLKLSKDTEISAQVIFGGGYVFSDNLFLNKGRKNGIAVDELVVYKNIFMIGRVEEVLENYSKVSTFSLFGVKTPFRTGIQKEILFEGEGNGGGEIFAIFPQGVNIDVGNTVWLGENSDFVVGVVEKINQEEGRDFKEVFVRVPVSFRSITDVTLFKNAKRN